VSDDNANLASKMMELKNDLINAQINYQTSDVVKVGQLLNSSAKVRTQQFTIKRNFSGDPVVEWEVRGWKYIFEAEAIDNVYMHPSRQDHFMVSILVTSRQTEREKEFVREQAVFIVKRLREFLMRANSKPM
jgi:hypothetical protein